MHKLRADRERLAGILRERQARSNRLEASLRQLNEMRGVSGASGEQERKGREAGTAPGRVERWKGATESVHKKTEDSPATQKEAPDALEKDPHESQPSWWQRPLRWFSDVV